MSILRTIPLIFLLAAMLLGGCATPTPPAEMVPELAATPQSLHGTVITVTEVTGGMETQSWNVGRIGNAEFRTALLQTLQNAGARTTPATTDAHDYTLSCEIISQNVVGNFDNTITLLVHYSLKNPNSQRIWAENILSEKELSVKDVFDGQTRRQKLQTSAIQDNFTTLIGKLANAIEADKQRSGQ